MRNPIVSRVFFIILFCFVTSNMVYFGFLENFTSTYTKDAFIRWYGAGVYQYRVLGKWLALALDEAIDPSGRRFAYTIFYMNTFFLMLTGIITVLLVHLKGVFIFSRSERNLVMLLVPLVINITQYTVVPYDLSGYFFQLLIMYIFLSCYPSRYTLTMIIVCLLLIVATLNRESSALTVAFLGNILIFRDGFSAKSLTSVSFFIWAFFLTYILLQWTIVYRPYNAISLLAGHLTKYVNIIGMLFWLLVGAFVYNLSDTRDNRRLVLLFHVFSLPYIFVVLRTGILWETRLYIPLFLGGLFSSKLNTAGPFAKQPRLSGPQP